MVLTLYIGMLKFSKRKSRQFKNWRLKKTAAYLSYKNLKKLNIVIKRFINIFCEKKITFWRKKTQQLLRKSDQEIS